MCLEKGSKRELLGHLVMHVPRNVNHKADLCRGALGSQGLALPEALGDPK